MFTNESEAYERVLNAVEDIGYCCFVEDDFRQWSDIAASSIQSFLDDLTAGQLDETCEAFGEYIAECTDRNLANGIREGLRICLEEMLDYIGDVYEDDEDDEDDYFAEYNSEKAELADSIKENIKELEDNENE